MALLGYIPPQGWPRGPNPQAILNDREIPLKIVQLTKSKVKKHLLNLGLTGMKAKGREMLLADIKAKRFRLVCEDVDSEMERDAGDEEDTGNDTDDGELNGEDGDGDDTGAGDGEDEGDFEVGDCGESN